MMAVKPTVIKCFVIHIIGNISIYASHIPGALHEGLQ